MAQSALLAASVGLGSCGLFGPDEAIVQVRMDSTAYHRPAPALEASIGFVLANPGSRSAYFVGCPGPVPVQFEIHTNGRWHDDVSANIICQAIYIPQRLEVRPGQSYHYSVSWGVPGRYRFRIYYGATPEAWGLFAVGEPFELR